MRNLGVEIVIDDFGAAAAAADIEPTKLRDGALDVFEVLRGFPLDVVKLDPRFVMRLERR